MHLCVILYMCTICQTVSRQDSIICLSDIGVARNLSWGRTPEIRRAEIRRRKGTEPPLHQLEGVGSGVCSP